jgi:hypothetical protein
MLNWRQYSLRSCRQTQWNTLSTERRRSIVLWYSIQGIHALAAYRDNHCVTRHLGLVPPLIAAEKISVALGSTLNSGDL